MIFKITVTSGRDINAYSFFPQVRSIVIISLAFRVGLSHVSVPSLSRLVKNYLLRSQNLLATFFVFELSRVTQEGEILLSPSHRFTVSSVPRDEGAETTFFAIFYAKTLPNICQDRLGTDVGQFD